ncbi:MAG: FAD-linked oxidase C-terminal domain-containing protein, partial [Bacteroidota bacterium]
MNTAQESKLSILAASLDGELYYDSMMRSLYATDASVYRELPQAVAMPKNKADIKQLIHFARTEGTSLIPRTAGTSLAGQCVGQGIVVDCSRYMTEILEVNPEESWVRVQPGVVRDELNVHLKPHGLFFGPNTSTANRAMIGGMVGNNSCGSYSLVYGSTRDHLMEVHAILSDGSEVVFKDLTEEEFKAKMELDSLEGKVYRHLVEELGDAATRKRIRKEFPKASIHRRNTGYAVDLLLETAVFSRRKAPFNFCKLIAGSEGTLAFITEIKIHIDPLPPPEIGLICVHFNSVSESLKAVLQVMKHKPRAVELMDKIVMDRTKESRMYRDYRFFIKGDPEAILIIEVGGRSEDEVDRKLEKMEDDLKETGFGYHYYKVFGEQIKKVWNLRKAGLGLLFNIKGDRKYVAVIEDTAVHVEDLPDYIEDFGEMMDRYGQTSVHYAHAGAGELHLRPILNLKDPDDRKMFRKIGHETALLVKKYQGSLSGEHGDGRVRAEFIPIMVGEENYELFCRLKDAWDPKHIFNPGKIVNAPPMDVSMRFMEDHPEKYFDTAFDFSSTDGILRATEKCNGSGDCRKTHLSGGTMCPSYMATRQEKDTTRARANILREVLTRSEEENPFAHEDIYEVMDLCLSCKGCASECPSNVNVATLKAEFLHQYYKKHGVPFRSKAFANISKLNGLGSLFPGLTNFILQKAGSGIIKKVLKVAHKRSLPGLYHTTLRKWYKKVYKNIAEGPVKAGAKGQVYFSCDEFSDYKVSVIGLVARRGLPAVGGG